MDSLEKVLETYCDFHDAIIVGFKYNLGFDFKTKKSTTDEIQIQLSCFNQHKKFDDSNELIEVKCSDIIHFKVRKQEMMIFQALLIKENNESILDLDPTLTSSKNGLDLIAIENKSSEFIIKCKNLSITKIQ